MKCGIQVKGKPACDEVLQKRRRDGALLCPVHCRAKTPRGPCKLRHYTGGVRCDRHGGKSRKGLSHPGLKDGRHANPRYLGVLSERYLERFGEREADKTRHTLDPEITMLDVRAEEILGQIMSGEYRSCTELLKMAEVVAAARASGDRDQEAAAWEELYGALKSGKAQERGWREFDELAWKRKPYLLEREARRRVLQQEMYERKVVVELLQAVAASVKRNVRDKDNADRIYRDILRLTGGGDEGVGRVSGRTSSVGH